MRQLLSLFADDLRSEVGNKTSLIGIYGRSINVPSYPALIGKIAVSTMIVFDAAEPITNIFIDIKKDGKSLASNQIPESFFRDYTAGIELAKTSGQYVEGDRLTMTINSLLNGVPIDQPGVMTVTVKIDDVEYPAGSIRFAVE